MDTKKITELVEAAFSADYSRVRKAANSIARLLEEAGDVEAAKGLRSVIRKKGVPLRTSGYMEQLPVDLKSRIPLLEEQEWPSSPLFLNEEAHSTLNDFVADVEHQGELSRGGLSSNLTMLLSGPPGTGKSLLAGHIASRLKRPLYVVRLDSLISSLLGDTAKNVRAIFDFAPTKDAVLFLDEIDAVAKIRDDRQELGELKRVVNTVLQGLDSLDDNTVVIAATNHPQLLDPAIWRRFPYQIDLEMPEGGVRSAMWRHFLFGDDDADEVRSVLGAISIGLSGADIERISMAARRRVIIGRNEKVSLDRVVNEILDTRDAVEGQSQRRRKHIRENRELVQSLASDGLNAPQIAKLLGMSRQWALKLLSEVENG